MGTDINTSTVLLKIADEIEAVLNEGQIPTPNLVIPKRIRFLAAQIAAHDRYSAEKAYRIAELADIFYSARKHSKYPGGHTALWHEMTCDLLGRIRNQAGTRQFHGD